MYSTLVDSTVTSDEALLHAFCPHHPQTTMAKVLVWQGVNVHRPPIPLLAHRQIRGHTLLECDCFHHPLL